MEDGPATPTLEATALVRELVENWASTTFVPATHPALSPGNADFTQAVEEKTNAVMGKFNALVIMMASNAADEHSEYFTEYNRKPQVTRCSRCSLKT